MAFERWTAQIAQANNPDAQRRLMGEIGAWRAANLTDIPGLREAAFAMSNLHHLVGERDAAVREARSLLSLCQTTPVATKEERQHASAFLTSLGERAPKLRVPRERRERGERRTGGGERRATTERREPAGYEAALQRALSGDHAGALKILKGKKGKAELARAWVRLSRALAADDRDKALEDLDRWFRQILGLASAPKAAPKVEAPTEEDGPLGALVGRKLPKRREARVRMLLRWLADNPAKADSLAATALDAHLAQAGPGAAAPWLATFVARALAAEGTETPAAIERLQGAGSVATAIYDEWAFGRAVQLAKAAGDRFSGLRRGVLGRGVEPDDRRGWTLRLDGEERMLVLVAESSEDYPTDVAAAMAARLPALCTRVVLLAPGTHNAGLREAVAGAGMVTLDGGPSDTELLSALDSVSEVAAPERPKREKGKERAPAPPKVDAPAPEPEPEGPPPLEVFEGVFFADPVASSDDLASSVGALKKLRDAFLAAERRWRPFPDDASARLGALMQAAHAVAPASLAVPEATTLALRVGAAQGGPAADVLVAEGTGDRFGGPGVADVLALVGAVRGAGWSLRRAFRGTTRRERRNNPALAELQDALKGLWRLGVENDGTRKEIWYVAELPVEGRAAVPQLLLEERDRIVVLPIDPDLMGWYGGLGGPEAIGWMAEDPTAVIEAL